jgi:DNA repair protein RadA/Sms
MRRVEYDGRARGGRLGAGFARGRTDRRRRRESTRRPEPIGDIEASEAERVSIGMAKFDRVLGSGIVAGASVLVGGEPGTGKSTLMLQMKAQMRSRPVLYATGEESVRQIRLRADPLGVSNPRLEILAENELERISTILAPRTAGPRTIEHMVDTVLYFERSDDDTRYVRASKNRFGSTDEVGLFAM